MFHELYWLKPLQAIFGHVGLVLAKKFTKQTLIFFYENSKYGKQFLLEMLYRKIKAIFT